MTDPYAVLGVSRTATDEEITSAYKKLARKYHPDLNPGDKNAEQKMKEINGAYETIKDIRSGKKADNTYYGSNTQGNSYGSNRSGSTYGSGQWQDPFGGAWNNPYGSANGTEDSESPFGSYGPFFWTTRTSYGSSENKSRRRMPLIFRIIAIFLIFRVITSIFSSLFTRSSRSNSSYYYYGGYPYGYYSYYNYDGGSSESSGSASRENSSFH